MFELRQIDTSTPQAVLDQIVRCEAVHAVCGPRDLWRRLQADRRCYALFSPEAPDEPLIFTEIALSRGITGDVSAILETESRIEAPESCDCAMFYSISRCQDRSSSIPLGNTLIRQVITRVQRELPSIRTFATVSPVPGFGRWLADLAARSDGALATVVAALDDARWRHDQRASRRLEATLLPLCASYLVYAKRGSEPLDSVARFHLANGAQLGRLHWLGDRTPAGLARSVGITANYLYELDRVEANAEAYGRTHEVLASPEIKMIAAKNADDCRGHAA
ncbi:MAG TPA: malonyl-CoA decarboxylase family protein [Vicinamibacterales bacterium]|nr:malonyl-CoA decarboxylase family protein [Vicinamibacterales bacterium]